MPYTTGYVYGNYFAQTGELTITEQNGSVLGIALYGYLFPYGGPQFNPGYKQSSFGIVNGAVVYVPPPPPPTPPTVTLGSGNLRMREGSSVAPFRTLVISDTTAAATETVVVKVANASGILSDPAAATDGSSFNAAAGTYTVTGSAAAVTQAIEGLSFIPNTYTLGAASGFVTMLTVNVTSSTGLTASDSTTSVTTYGALIAANFGGAASSSLLVQHVGGAALIYTTNGLGVTAATSWAMRGPAGT